MISPDIVHPFIIKKLVNLDCIRNIQRSVTIHARLKSRELRCVSSIDEDNITGQTSDTLLRSHFFPHRFPLFPPPPRSSLHRFLVDSSLIFAHRVFASCLQSIFFSFFFRSIDPPPRSINHVQPTPRKDLFLQV